LHGRVASAEQLTDGAYVVPNPFDKDQSWLAAAGISLAVLDDDCFYALEFPCRYSDDRQWIDLTTARLGQPIALSHGARPGGDRSTKAFDREGMP